MDVIIRKTMREVVVMDISIKKVLNNNYASRFWLIFSILSPIFGVCVLLSVFGALPKFPLTENMSVITAVLIMLVCIGITLIGIFSIRNTISKLKNILTNGEMITATITGVLVLKHQLLVYYEFEYGDETCKDSHNISKKLDYKADYSKGRQIKIFVLKNSKGNIVTAPDIY